MLLYCTCMCCRLKLLNLIIQSKPSENSENLKISRYLRNKWILGYFPLHNQDVMRELGGEWLRPKAMPWEQPLFAIKEYFGEKVGHFWLLCGGLIQCSVF